MTNDSHRVIRASEIGAFGNCAHAWWLGQVEGVRPDNAQRLDSGSAAHERHGQRVLLAGALNRLAYFMLALAGLVGALWLISALVG